jgi:UDP:flavonoid glycosyltransferase YjiC (YdhE family)
MRVLFAASAWLGHFYPMVPVGWALQADGHEVRVLCDPAQADSVARTGLPPLPVLEHGDLVSAARLGCYIEARDGRWPYPVPPLHPDTGDPLASVADFDFSGWFIRRKKTWWPQATRSADAAAAVARAWRPELVVHGLQSLEGFLAAAVAGVPGVIQLWGPLGPDDVRPGLPLLPADVSRAFERHDAGPLDFSSASLFLDPSPGSVAALAARGRLPVRYLTVRRYPPAPDALEPDDLEPDALWPGDQPSRPRVCVLWPSICRQVFGPVTFVVPQILTAAAELGARVTLLLGDEDLAACGELAPGVTAHPRAALADVLPGCAALVHPGSGSSALTALALGVPQLALPLGLDQSVIAARLAAAGAGRYLACHEATGPAVLEALGGLLADAGHRAAAARLAHEMAAMPPPADVVPALAELAGLAPGAATPASA